MTRQYEYRNPLDILISREEQTCKGCKHWTKFLVFSDEK